MKKIIASLLLASFVVAYAGQVAAEETFPQVIAEVKVKQNPNGARVLVTLDNGDRYYYNNADPMKVALFEGLLLTALYKAKAVSIEYGRYNETVGAYFIKGITLN